MTHQKIWQSIASAAAALLFTAGVHAQQRTFDLPEQDATRAIPEFARQAGIQISAPTAELKGMRTPEIKGELDVRAALKQLLRGTGLSVVSDEGGMIVLRKSKAGDAVSDGTGLDPAHSMTLAQVEKAQADKPGARESARSAPKPAESSSATPEEGTDEASITVLGSRIRRNDTEGPSSVHVYDREYIRATGALTLADFLNRLPQNYAGISAGRGSAPNELNPEFGQRTESTFPAFNFVMGASDAPPGQTGVSGVSLRGLGSGSTLVLVDGRRMVQSGAGNRSTDSQQGFVDLNTIPLATIDHIEVITDGASALYGADAVAGVINIVTKKDWTGGELTVDDHGSFEGGGQERNASLSYGFSTGRLRTSLNLQAYGRDPLKASQRDFSANQDHSGIVAGYDTDGTPIYGRDLRLLYGYPGTIQASQNVPLNGILGPDGLPTQFATINPGITGTPTIADFTGALPGLTGGADYIRRGNTADFLDLIPESTRYGASGTFNFALTDRIEAYGKYSYNDIRGTFNTQPGLTAAATFTGFGFFLTQVPAAYNPFNQDIIVGMTHYEFGSVWQKTHTRAHAADLGLRGTIGRSWQWDSAVRYQKQAFSQIMRGFDGTPITAALANPDPALRLNPFIDARVAGITQARLYEQFAYYPTLDTGSSMKYWDIAADGELFRLPGGAVRMAVGGFYERDGNDSDALNYQSGFFGLTPSRTTIAGERDSLGAYAELSVPLIGRNNALPGMRRLDIQLAGRYEDRDEAGHATVPRVGFSWVPVSSLLLRGNYSEGFRAPSLTEYQIPSLSYQSYVTDPLRDDGGFTIIEVTQGSNPNVRPETSWTASYGLQFDPQWLPGLSLAVDYYKTRQENAIQIIREQTMVNNESFFPGRVTRAAPTPADIALGQPGAITSVDTTLTNFGSVVAESLDFRVDYDLPSARHGTLKLSVNASHTLQSTRELAPGRPAVDDNGDTFAPPSWRYTVFAFWNRGPWNASAFFTYLSRFSTNRGGNMLTEMYPVPSQTNLDLNAGYTFERGLGFWGEWSKGLKVNAGIGNVFGEDPPFSDTVFGYNGGLHSPLGRTYQLALQLPF